MVDAARLRRGHEADDGGADAVRRRGRCGRVRWSWPGARYRRPADREPQVVRGRQRPLLGIAGGGQALPGEEIALVGAGNSAGQAVVFLAPHVKRLTMIVRGAGPGGLDVALPDRPDQVAGERRYPGSIRDGRAPRRSRRRPGRRDRRNRDSGATSNLPARQVFMFIGAEPNTAWLNGCLALDEHGYILTGLRRPRRQCAAPAADEPVARVRNRRCPLRLDQARGLRRRRRSGRRRPNPLDPGRRNHDGVTAAAVTAAAPKAHTRYAPVGEVCRSVLRWRAALVG